MEFAAPSSKHTRLTSLPPPGGAHDCSSTRRSAPLVRLSANKASCCSLSLPCQGSRLFLNMPNATASSQLQALAAVIQVRTTGESFTHRQRRLLTACVLQVGPGIQCCRHCFRHGRGGQGTAGEEGQGWVAGVACSGGHSCLAAVLSGLDATDAGASGSQRRKGRLHDRCFLGQGLEKDNLKP